MRKKWIALLLAAVVLTAAMAPVLKDGFALDESTELVLEAEPAAAPSLAETPAAESTPQPTAEPAPVTVEESTPQPAPMEEPAAEFTENPGPESTEEPGMESTEEPGAESTEEPGTESTEEPGTASTEEPVPEPTEQPTAAPELRVSLSTEALSVFAGEQTIDVRLTVEGGAPEYAVVWQVSVEDGVIQECAGSVDPDGRASFSYLPDRFGVHTVQVSVADSEGQCREASVQTPVAVREVEHASDWARSVRGVEYTGDWRQDLVSVAQTQIGYAESRRNFIIDADGEQQGYTRYGDWYGASYSEWCAMFVSFCLEYAGVPERDFPHEANCANWKELLVRIHAYEDDEHTYVPAPGDLIFFNWDGRNTPKHVGIVEKVQDGRVYTIEGNSAKSVRRREYALNSSDIVGYANTAALMERAGVFPTPEPTEEPTPEPTEEPTPEPTEEPTPEPTEEPTPEPTEEPTPEPTEEPTPEPTEVVYYCNLEAHEHGEACFNEDGEFICSLPAHVHDDSCSILPTLAPEVPGETELPEYHCGQEEHAHGETCYNETGTLICEQPEHAHTDECLIAPEVPGETESPEYFCGQEEHTHGETCYDATGELICGQPEHAHTDECLIAPEVPSETELPEYHCGQEEHAHGETCYDETGALICEQPEHAHTDECLIAPEVPSETELPEYHCGQEEHAHGETCYDETGALICEQPEHAHTDECLIAPEVPGETESPEYHCGQEEHTHGETCYNETGELICEQPEHTHTDECLIAPEVPSETELPEHHCGQEEHTHGETCYDATGELICGQPEHTHTDECLIAPEVPGETESPEYFCGQEEHAHGETCYDETGELICGQPEHTHTEECLHPAVRTVAVEIYTDGTYSTPVEDGTEIILTGRIPADAAARAFPADAGTLEQALCAYDIEIVRANGEVYEPEEQITVSIRSPGLSELAPEGLMDVYYIPENGDPQRIDSELIGDGVVFAADHFSVYAVTLDAETGGTVFTYENTDAGLSVTLTLQSTGYTTAEYDLMAVEQSDQDYQTALGTFTKHGEVIHESAIYKIYLIRKGDSAQNPNYPYGEYSLEMRWANGLFEPMGEATETLHCAYCQNSGSEATDLPGCTVSTDENGAAALTASASSYPGSGEFLFVQTYAPNGLTAGSYTLKYNSVKDAFLNDPAYSKYYNANSPIGTAGSFHIVAFDTAYLSAHTNGNVLAKKLDAQSNFGTNNFADELSYVQVYRQVNATSASNEAHVLALGSGNVMDFADNGNAFSVNGVKIDKPKNLVQDTDTATAPFIDLARVEREINSLSAKFNNFSDANLAEHIEANNNRLTLQNPSSVGVGHYTAAELARFGNEVEIDGFQSGKSGTVVINVDCASVSSVTMPRAYIVIDGQKQSTNEVTEFSNGKVIWNFVNAGSVTINTETMTGIILAPGATVNINQNLNGTVVAENINVRAESHRTDFTGNVVPPSEDTEADEYYITVQKTETGFVAQTLPGAEFNLYKWDGSTWLLDSGGLVTDDNGVVMLRNLDASVAYKLEEIKAPEGYLQKKEAYCFWVRTDKNQTQPVTRPDDFSGSAVEVGGILIAANDKLEGLSLTVKKIWKNSSGQTTTDVPVESITVEVLQDGVRYQELTLNKQNSWQATLANLPKTDAEGNAYDYTVKEIAVDGYGTGIQYETDLDTGCITVTITNTRDKEQYKLPETGETGNSSLYVAGALLLVAGAFLLYVRKQREGAVRH